jgi:hypothetical protein
LINIKKPVGIGAMVGWRTCMEAGRRLGQQLSTLEGNTMATYVTLYNFTDQGLKNIMLADDLLSLVSHRRMLAVNWETFRVAMADRVS